MIDIEDDDIDEGPDQADADLLDEEIISLETCPNCGRPVYEEAQQCPYCKEWITHSAMGEGLRRLRAKPLWWILLAILGVAMFVWLFVL